VNTLLNLITPTKKLLIDGRLGSRPENSKTVAAIKLFQSKIVNMVRPDGKIDPNGRTHKKINEKLASAAVAAAVPVSGNLKAKLKQNMMKYEGNVPHMYLDTKGYVTVGVGHLLKDVEAAKKVLFTVRDTGIVATTKQIEDEFKLIKSRPFGKDEGFGRFKPFTKLIITEAVANAQVDQHIKTFESELKRIYGASEFASYPDDVKLALFDLIFNLGMTKLKGTFPNFNKYMKVHDFKKAAIESNRKDVSAERNAYVRNLLANAK
jgi:GH24 family phage-related lysozyme (muramidase)